MVSFKKGGLGKELFAREQNLVTYETMSGVFQKKIHHSEEKDTN